MIKAKRGKRVPEQHDELFEAFQRNNPAEVPQNKEELEAAANEEFDKLPPDDYIEFLRECLFDLDETNEALKHI